MLALYGHRFSSYTWKALIPLYANGTEFEFREVGPDHPEHGAFIAKAHPTAKFPVLVDGETVVFEATAIVEYLAAQYPGDAPLIPASPKQAALTRMMDRVFDNYVMNPMQKIVGAVIDNPDNPDPRVMDTCRQELRHIFEWLEGWLTRHELPPHVSLVTCAAAPSLFYADWVERIPATCPRLAALRAELLALPPVARCVDDARQFRAFFPLGAPDRD